MRYRPFGRAGAAVSALSLALTDRPMRADDRIRLIYTALEAGVNTFELQSLDPEVAANLGEALQAVERGMVFVSVRVGWTRDREGARIPDLGAGALTGAVDATLGASGLDRFDVVILDTLEAGDLPEHVVPTLQAVQAAGRTRLLGVAGADSADRYIGGGVFEVLHTPFNIHSGWLERNRLKTAGAAEMAIVGARFHPFSRRQEDTPVSNSALRRLLSPNPPKAPGKADGPYAFLERTPGWTSEEICLAFALTEPGLATVQTQTSEAAALQKLAMTVEHDLPNGLSAQIEMARFSLSEAGGAP